MKLALEILLTFTPLLFLGTCLPFHSVKAVSTSSVTTQEH